MKERKEGSKKGKHIETWRLC